MAPRNPKKDPNEALAEKLGPPPEDDPELAQQVWPHATRLVPEEVEPGLDPPETYPADDYVELKGGGAVVATIGEPPPKPVVVLLAEVLAELPAIGKDGSASGLTYNFRQVDDIVNETKPLFAKKGIVPVPRALSRIGEERFTRGGAALYVTHLEVAYRFYGPRGDFVEAVVWGEGMDNFDKATSKALTMAYKSCLIQIFNIATGDPDPDASLHEETTGSRRPTTAGANTEAQKAARAEIEHKAAVEKAVSLGWADGEEGLRLHKAIADRIRILGEEDESDKQLIAEFRKEANLTWPMGPEDWNRLDEFVETLEGPGPEPEGDTEEPDFGPPAESESG